MPLWHLRKSVARMLGRDKYVLGIDSVIKVSGAATSALIKSGSRPPQSVRAEVVVRGLRTTAQQRRHRELPPHHRAAAAAVPPALAARAQRVVAPAAMSGRGGLWSEVSGRAHMGTLVGNFTFRLTVALGAAARDSAAFCRASHWDEFSAIHCSASFSQLNIAPSISCLRACPQVTKATQPRRSDRGEASK
jgi:hypothetical protein